MTDLTITDTKDVWVVYTNTDLTEGRGYQYPIHVCGSPATAERMAIRKKSRMSYMATVNVCVHGHGNVYPKRITVLAVH